MSVFDWFVLFATFIIGFAINDYLRNLLQARGHDRAAVGVAIVVAAVFAAVVLMIYTGFTR